MLPEPSAFVADAALRLDAPLARPRRRARLAAAIFGALAVEAAVFALIWFERASAPAPEVNEIPVEIVVEPPPPPPPQEQQQEYEKPATDAPRAGKSDHDDEHVAEKEKPAAAPPPPAPTPSPEATQPAAQTPAPELPKTAEAEAPPPQKTEPKPAAPKPMSTSVADLPLTFPSVPEIDFGGEAIKSPVTGGNAKSSYLTMLYGLIVPRLHVPAVAHAYGRRLTGSITFGVDGRGRLVYRAVSMGSGSMEFDEAAMEAVASASHAFPAPPKGAPIGMTFTYSAE